MKKIISVLLVTATLLSLLTIGVSAGPVYRLDGLSEDYIALMQAEDEMILGSISAKYESNGDPGCISRPDCSKSSRPTAWKWSAPACTSAWGRSVRSRNRTYWNTRCTPKRSSSRPRRLNA